MPHTLHSYLTRHKQPMHLVQLHTASPSVTTYVNTTLCLMLC
jgi:hypothetical protein